ncbi:flippase-like domain-containing protein [Allosphingosinicella flava]|uniref:Flippase-like domain-containing protein n=1 Tax=Allosphingosinicella flava TaxID=2771430 RepID=A0A7T2GJE2_9SPHN|nr:lysylphosphatidylglycerol synthase transmembrane domain-containing protein [Sphingosinicella flava]QPQ54973.1 flippase-like domain-containing protein [Sphingosinicella flava]
MSGDETVRQRLPLAALFVGLLVFAALVAIVLNFGELRQFTAAVRRAEPLWLIVALGLQLSTYISVAGTWSAALKKAGHPLPLRSLVPLSISKLFADQAVPTAGMSGNVLLVNQLIRRGLPRAAALSVLLVSIVGYYIAYAVMAVAILVLLWLHAEASVLLAISVSVFLAVAFLIGGIAFWLGRRGRRPLPPFLARIGPVRQLYGYVGEAHTDLLNDRRLILRSAGFNLLIFLADAATLQVCLFALGGSASFATALIALVMASIAVTLGPIPLGLGSFEAVSITMLHFLDVNLALAAAGTLLLRGFTLWLPLIPGLLLSRRLLRRKHVHGNQRA